MTDPVIELVKATEPFAKGDHFDRGERIIVVDGVRWGRTRVKSHGRNGMSYHFEQEAGDMLMRDPAETETWKEYKWLRLHGTGKWERYQKDRDPRTTEKRIIDKVRELIAADRLRHPNIVREEAEEKSRLYRAKREAKIAAREVEFRDRACKALGMNQDDGSEIIDRVVAAMYWASEQ